MSKIYPVEKIASSKGTSKTIWKVVAEDLQKESPKTRDCEEYKHIKLIIYPDDSFFEYWSYFISMLLLYTCIISPYRVCVSETETADWMIIDITVDSLFFVDVVINSLLAYYDEESNLVTDRKKIFLNYLKSWMIVDLVSCVQVQYMFAEKNYSSLLRITKVSKLYRLAKLVRFLRMIKLVNRNNKILRYMSTIFRVHIALERLIWFLITFLLLVHILACFWVFIGKFDQQESDRNWIYMTKMQDYGDWQIYLAAVYWATTTLTTVGYGDIKAYNSNERVFACLSMIIGIFLYSYIIGSLTNLLSNLDVREAKLTRKLDIVNRLHREYPSIDKSFYKKIATALEYRHKNTKSNIDSLINDLPLTLRTKLLIVIYQKDLQGNAFFENKNTDFVAFVAPMLKPMRIEQGDYVFKTKELACEMYFIISGEIEMSLDYKDDLSLNDLEIPFNLLKQGYYFGETDLLFSESSERSYNAKATQKTELLVLSKEGFETLLKRFEDESTLIMNLACGRNVRLKEHQQAAVDIFLQNKMFRKHISFPMQVDDQETTDRGFLTSSIHVIPANTVNENDEFKTRNVYNTFIEDKLGKVESDIDWTKKKLKILKSNLQEARENIIKVIEVLL
jgi:CRP-like cAMP-binding protein